MANSSILPKQRVSIKARVPCVRSTFDVAQNASAQEDVIKRFQEAHGGLYDYSQVVYTGIINKVKIICSVHGPFWQRPNNHMDGHGCAACGNSLPYTAETFAQASCCRSQQQVRIRKGRLQKQHDSCDNHMSGARGLRAASSESPRGKGCWKCRTLGYSKQQIAWLEVEICQRWCLHSTRPERRRAHHSEFLLRADGYSRGISHSVSSMRVPTGTGALSPR